jgi:hypothetical protein
MSPARTGSVGASALASRIAAATGSPITQTPYAATAAIVSGIVTTRSRATDPHARAWSGRSSFSPVEKSAITTASSLRRSISSASSRGTSQSIPVNPITTAAASPSAR